MLESEMTTTKGFPGWGGYTF